MQKKIISITVFVLGIFGLGGCGLDSNSQLISSAQLSMPFNGPGTFELTEARRSTVGNPVKVFSGSVDRQGLVTIGGDDIRLKYSSSVSEVYNEHLRNGDREKLPAFLFSASYNGSFKMGAVVLDFGKRHLSMSIFLPAESCVREIPNLAAAEQLIGGCMRQRQGHWAHDWYATLDGSLDKNPAEWETADHNPYWSLASQIHEAQEANRRGRPE